MGDLFMRLGQGSILFLQLSEQAHVLDGYDGLVGEGLYEIDLGRGEAPHFTPVDRQSADEPAFLDQRDVEESPESFVVDAPDPHLVAAPVRLGGSDVLDLPGLPGSFLPEKGPAEVVAPASQPLEMLSLYPDPLGQPEHAIVVVQPQVPEVRAAEPRRTLEDRPEDRLHICESARDDP